MKMGNKKFKPSISLGKGPKPKPQALTNNQTKEASTDWQNSNQALESTPSSGPFQY